VVAAECEDKKKFVYQAMSEEIMDRIAELRQQKSSHPNPLPGEEGRVTGISS